MLAVHPSREDVRRVGPPPKRTHRLRILISAYACEPGKGSEPYVGWNLPCQLARYHEVWVLTRSNNRLHIEAELQRHPHPGLHPVYLDLPRATQFWKKGRRGIHLYYLLWQIGALIAGWRLHRKVQFDVIHHLTLGMDWMPSLLAFLPVPFVWGPMVGAQSVSNAFLQHFTWAEKSREYARDWIRQLSRIDPLTNAAIRRTALAMAGSSELAETLRARGCRNVVMYPPIGLSNDEVRLLEMPRNRDTSHGLRFLFVGNLYGFRAVSLVLRAFADTISRLPGVEFWIVGDGPERENLIAIAAAYGIQTQVKFWGALAREKVLDTLAACDVLIYPCLRGAISMACLEAMAAGLPIIGFALGGTPLQVSAETGVIINAFSPDQVVRDLAAAMKLLAEDHALCRRLGEAARARVRAQFIWEEKAKTVASLYEQVVVPSAVSPA